MSYFDPILLAKAFLQVIWLGLSTLGYFSMPDFFANAHFIVMTFLQPLWLVTIVVMYFSVALLITHSIRPPTHASGQALLHW